MFQNSVEGTNVRAGGLRPLEFATPIKSGASGVAGAHGVAPAALQADIMNQFSINAKQFGILMSAYYITYTPLQLFVGSLMD